MNKLLLYLIGLIVFQSCVSNQKGDCITNETKQHKPAETINILTKSLDNNGINIINTGPRGGSYTNPNGSEIRYTLFRIQLINDTIIPLDFEILFPAKPLPLLPDSTVLLGISLLPDSLTPNNIQDDLNFGVIGIENYFESEFSSPSILKTSIQPKEQLVFYIGILFKSKVTNGTTRSILYINGQDIDAPFLPVTSIEKDKINDRTMDLVYGIGVDPPNHYRLIPCGSIKYLK